MMVTDATGKICMFGQDMIDDLDCEPEDILGKNVDDLVRAGYYSTSSTRECINTKRRVDCGVDTKNGGRRISTSNPVFDQDGNLIYVITNTRNFGVMEAVVKELEEYKSSADKYKSMANYFGKSRESSGPIAVSPQMKEIIRLCAEVAPIDCTVLLTGDSGTGKEVCASYIHEHSSRARKIFIPINCGAIPPDLIESELFGYEKGAFTGADSKGKMGLTELADGGTLFLDEIGELPLQAQSKILRFIETGESRKLGSNKSIRTNVRLIAATNRDLKKMVREHKFREDLYYRLNVIHVQICPLRERRADIIPLAEHFLGIFNKKYNKDIELKEEDRKWLQQYDYPGNIRELRNIVERNVITGRMENSQESHFAGSANAGSIENPAALSPAAERVSLRQAVQEYESAYIARTIEECGGNMTKAAKMLGIHRTQLYKKINRSNDVVL